jgi:nucleoside-diphosphate-sugar epimerase
MILFVAGATGVIGQPLLRLLRDAGHAVTGTDAVGRQKSLDEAVGARGVVVDAFDARRCAQARGDRGETEVVIHQLTDLPDVSDPSQMAGGARERIAPPRIEGTRNLMAAAQAAGVRRVVAQEHRLRLCAGTESLTAGGRPARFAARPTRDDYGASTGLEEAVLNTPGIDGMVLRYGRLYGPGTWFDKPGSAGAADDRCGGARGAAGGDQGRARRLQASPRIDGEFSVEKARTANSAFDPEIQNALELRPCKPVNRPP